MKNIGYYSLIAIILVIVAGLIWGFGINKNSNLNISNNDSLNCISAGEVFKNPSLGPDGNFGECCGDLIGISNKNNYDEICDFSGMVGLGSICSDCGNGVCEEWESNCNCPSDC